MLEKVRKTDIASQDAVELAEAYMLSLPQAECSVVHHFGPGIYIREVHLPAGVFAIGHKQRFEQLNIMITGAVAMVRDGKMQILRAPLIYVGPPGRKSGYVIEDTVWQNVYATEETDIDKLESMFLKKSETWEDHHAELMQVRNALHEEDRRDYRVLLDQLGITESQVRAETEDESDQIDMPHGSAPKFTVRQSCIEGQGAFLSAPAESGEVLAPARLNGKRTPAGRYVNHSKYPNAEFVMSSDGNINLVAIRPISGCIGSDQGDEVTVNYRGALELSGIFLEKSA